MTKRALYLLILFAVIIALDQGSKAWIFAYRYHYGLFKLVYPYGGIGVFENILGIDFSINYVTNEGAAWGLFSHYRWVIFGIRSLLILVLSSFLFFYNRDKLLELPIVMILGGAIGNMIDVISHGYVIDMFKFILWGYAYPVFNVADAFVCIGVTLWVALAFFSRPKKVLKNDPN